MDRRSFLAATGAFVSTPALLRASDGPVKLRDLYNRDQSVSDLALSLAGKSVDVGGFMAPPLKANSKFFVLTGMPMAVCPLCEAEAEWPDDFVAIYTRRVIRVVPFNWPIVVTGTLEPGTYMDEEFGVLSRARLVDATYERA